MDSSSTTAVQSQFAGRPYAVTAQTPGVAIRRAFDAKPSVVAFDSGTYFFDAPLTFPGCEIDGRGSTLVLNADGDVFGHRLSTGTRLRNFRIITRSHKAASSPAYQSALVAGQYFGLGQPAHGWSVENVDLVTDSPGASGAYIFGDCQGWRMSGIRVGDSAAMARAVSVHWGCCDTNSPPDETFHPSGSIDGLTAGRLTQANNECAPVFVSAPGNVSIQNVTCDEAWSGALIYAGDHAYDLQRPKIGGVVTLRNIVVRRCRADVTTNGSTSPLLLVEKQGCLFARGQSS